MNNRFRIVHPIFTICFSFSFFCAPDAQARQPATENPVHKRITPIVLVEKKLNGGQSIPEDTYTRLQIVAAAPGLEVTSYATRPLIFRLGIGKKYTFGSMLKAETGFFKDTIPLISREYESSSKAGETFERSISADKFDFPYFLSGMESSSRVGKFTVTANMVETTSSRVSSLALTLMRNSLKAVAPSAGILTTLTKDSTEVIANTIDQQASMLFGTTVGEEISFDLDLSHANSYEVTIYGPEKELNSIKQYAKPHIIGKWTISFAPPRPSAFSALTCSSTTLNPCDWRAAYNDAVTRPGSVLAFKLVNRIDDLGTMAAYLLHKEWWTREMVALEAAPASAGAIHAQFCRKIRDTVTELGFNDLDGRIVAAAVSKSGLVSGKVKAGLEAQSDCKYG